MKDKIQIRRKVIDRVSKLSTVVEPAVLLTTRPTVSVIVLCYKYGEYLTGAVQSVLNQEGVDVEVLIVDDASPDDSGSVALNLARCYPRVTAQVLDQNLGPVGAFNSALPHVSGKYLVRLDADDELTPGALARSVALLEHHPEVGFVYGRPLQFYGDNLPKPRITPSSWSIWDGKDWLQHRCRAGVNSMTSPEVVIRSSLQKRIGGQLEELGHTHDMEMWLRASKFGAVARLNGVDQAFIRIHPASRMRTLYKSKLLDLDQRRRAFELALASEAGWDFAQLWTTARQTIAREAIDHAKHALERGLSNDEPVEDYVQLAEQVWPPISESRGYSGLIARLSVGPIFARWIPHYVLAAALRGIRQRLNFRYWRWSGL